MVLALIFLACGTKHRTDDQETDGGIDEASDVDSETFIDVVSSDSETSIDLVSDWKLSWAKSAGGLGIDFASDVVFADGSLFMTGWFSDAAIFGKGETNETSLWGGPGSYAFLARHDPENGNLVWVKRAGSEDGYCMGKRLDVDDQGWSVVTGFFDSPGTLFGEGEPNETCLDLPAGTGSRDAFLALFEGDGTLAWVVAPELPGDWCPHSTAGCWSEGEGVSFSQDGSILVSGKFWGKMILGAGEPNETELESASEDDKFDAFLAKFAPNGELIWAKSFGGTGIDSAESVAASADGSFFVLGTFSGEVVFGEGEQNETTLASAGTSSAFLARYDNDGVLCWTVDIGVDGSVYEEAGELSLATNGDVIVSGRFSGKLKEGPGEGDAVAETPEQGRGLFVGRYSPDGERVWMAADTCAVDACNMFHGGAWSADALSDGTVVAAGSIDYDGIFGQGEEHETVLPFRGGETDSYIAMYRPDGDLLWTINQGGPDNDVFFGVEILEDTYHNESIVVCGRFGLTVTFGTGGGDEIDLTSADLGSGQGDIVLLRYDVQIDIH